jgi:hypothetical protein
MFGCIMGITALFVFVSNMNIVVYYIRVREASVLHDDNESERL